MLMRQAMKVCMPAMVTGVDRHRLQASCELSVVQSGSQNRFILEALQSRHCQHHQSLVVQDHQESGPRRLPRSRGTSTLMLQCSHGKHWDDLI